MNEYENLVNECSLQGQNLARIMANNGILEPMYLYARKSTEKNPGKLFLVRYSTPIPDGVYLVTGEGLRCNIPYENYFQWVYDRAKREPILSID